jgi:outer membrane protein TolC
MNTSESAAALEAELRVVEEDLARLRETAADLRRRIGEREDEPTDPAERSALIEQAEEQEALIDMLNARREGLLRELGRPGTGTGPVDRPLLSDLQAGPKSGSMPSRSSMLCQSPQLRPDATTALVPYRPATVDGAGSG